MSGLIPPDKIEGQRVLKLPLSWLSGRKGRFDSRTRTAQPHARECIVFAFVSSSDQLAAIQYPAGYVYIIQSTLKGSHI